MLLRPAVLATCALLALTACSPSDEPVIESSPTASPTAAPTTTPTIETPTSAPTTAVPTKSPALPTCRGSALTVTDADSLITPSFVTEVFVVRTTGPRCQLDGYPAVRLLGADGRPLPVTLRHGGAGLPPEQPQPVSLSRDTSLSFDVSTPRTGSCQDATAIVATLPGTTTAHRATTDLRVCGSTVGISPVHRRGDTD